MNIFIKVSELEKKIEKLMRSETDTQYRKSLNNKLTLLIVLWILDKLTMAIMFWIFK